MSNLIQEQFFYIPDFIEENKHSFQDEDNTRKNGVNILWDLIDWERREDSPRNECWYADPPRPYTYGKGRGIRTYESKEIPSEICLLWVMVEGKLGCKFEGCFVNGYEDGSDHLGWHADDGPDIDSDRPIAVWTFGAEREIWLREISSGVGGASMQTTEELNRVEKIKLENGSLFVMKPGCQETCQHRIPKAGFICGRRISFTFRGLKNDRSTTA